MKTLKSVSENCKVCNSIKAQKHFGAVCCKACAAFFRRYVNSKKEQMYCSCWNSKNKLKLCQLCRMQRCLAAGMEKCRVQFPRKNSNLPMTVQSREFDRIRHLEIIYNSLQGEREYFRDLMTAPWKTTIRGMTSAWEDDSRTMWKICVRAFPEIENFSHFETERLLHNFYPKWFGFTSAIAIINSGTDVWPYSPPSLDLFYEPDALIQMENNIFTPYWEYYSFSVLKPIFDMKLDNLEVTAIMALIFMDSGYSNVSEKVHEMCCDFRKVIKTQLVNYYKEVGKPIERLLEIMDALLIIERFDGKIHEELQLCGLNGITLDKGCLQILSVPKL